MLEKQKFVGINAALKEEFKEALKINPKDLEKIHIMALIKRVEQLSDEERYRFRDILVRENMSPEEEKTARKRYPKEWFQKYFPYKKNVETHYQKNFTLGRK
jgi:hypothetical protein